MFSNGGVSKLVYLYNANTLINREGLLIFSPFE